MRYPITVTLDAGTIEALREAAHASRRKISHLVDEYVVAGLREATSAGGGAASCAPATTATRFVELDAEAV